MVGKAVPLDAPPTGVFGNILTNEICDVTKGFVSVFGVFCKSTLRLGFAEVFLLTLERDLLFRFFPEVIRPTAVPAASPRVNKIVRSILITFHSAKWDISESLAYTRFAERLTPTVSPCPVNGRDLFSATSAENYEKAQLALFA
jgi:hypothetical protein